jgi:hypothetical protein
MRAKTTMTAIAMAAAVLALPANPVGAGVIEPGDDLRIEPTGDRTVPSFDFSVPGDPGCDGRSVTLEGDDGIVDPEERVTFIDDLTGTLDLSGLPAGYYELTIDCQNGEFPVSYAEQAAFARLTVTKVVEGTAPADAAFTIEVDCSAEGEGEGPGGATFVEDLVFGPTGGEQGVILYAGALCTTTETDDAGATSSSVEGGEADFFSDPIDLAATVTNVFAAAPPAPPAPTPPGAQPVVAQPDFTG